MEGSPHDNSTEQRLGELIQGYTEARWTRAADGPEVIRLARRLDPVLRDRIDALGSDAEQLLDVSAVDVLSKLSALEHQAAQEDAAASQAAARLRAREERTFDHKQALNGHARVPSPGRRRRTGRRGRPRGQGG